MVCVTDTSTQSPVSKSWSRKEFVLPVVSAVLLLTVWNVRWNWIVQGFNTSCRQFLCNANVSWL